MSEPKQGAITERELEVVCLRFGIGSPTEEGKTLQEIAEMYGVSRERVRQIEGKALRKLRNNPQMKRLRHLVTEV